MLGCWWEDTQAGVCVGIPGCAFSLWHPPLPGPGLQELLEAVHLHLVKEYITRLCKRRLVLKTAEQQQQLAGLVQANAQDIQQFCTQSVSPTHPPSSHCCGLPFCSKLFTG